MKPQILIYIIFLYYVNRFHNFQYPGRFPLKFHRIDLHIDFGNEFILSCIMAYTVGPYVLWVSTIQETAARQSKL